MTGTDTSQLEVVLLTEDDAGEVFSLYELSRNITPYGFLAIRNEDDYRALLRDRDRVIATGIRHEGQLIAHSVCHRLDRNPYPDNPILAAIDPSTSRMFHGDGTMVHPDYQGRLIAKRIFRLREQQMAERRIDHMVGLVAIDNLVSIGNVLHSGALLVGFARDETAMNYIAYGGRLKDRLDTASEPVEAGWRNHDIHSSLFAERRAVCGIVRQPRSADGESDRLLSFRPIG